MPSDEGGLAPVRRVLGKTVLEVSPGEFAAFRGGYSALIVDIGTGDGKHAWELAREQPDALVVGLDANPDRLRERARKAAAASARGGLPNLVYLWASVERFPALLTGISELHILMPWGSLLEAVVRPDPAVLAALARACAPGARFLVTVNLHPWHPEVPEVVGLPEPGPASLEGTLGEAYAAAGWTVEESGYLDPEAIAALRTSWTSRLGSSRREFEVLGFSGRIGSP
jgi:16S rRNA (adenine(1408)-N(1))-methyltransferase